MSRLQMYTVKDKKADAYLQPFTTQTKGLAIRMIQGTLEQQDNNLSKYPEDFSLWKIGEFDENSGIIQGLQEPELVSQLTDLV